MVSALFLHSPNVLSRGMNGENGFDYICVSVYNLGMKLENSKIIFNALADETRLRILNLLCEGELCVCDVMKVLREPQSKVSRHLAYLRRAGLVEARKEGLWMHYKLAKGNTPMLKSIFHTLKCCREGSPELESDYNEFKKTKTSLIACCK